jgi:hypothetical protein
MPTQRETLAYLLRTDMNLSDFINYCKFGKKDGAGNYVIDPVTQRKMTGVVNWLRGNQIFEGNFFIDSSPQPAMLVLVPPTPLPWLSIPGFNGFLRPGTIGANHAGAICGNAIAFVLNPKPDIDELLPKRKDLFEAVPEARREELNRALRGEGEVDLNVILRELNLFDVVNPA